jgi:hypothetical protein
LVENVSERTLERNYLLSLISNAVQNDSIVTYSFPLVNAAKETYDGAQFVATQDDATDASEDASLVLKLMKAGTLTTALSIANDGSLTLPGAANIVLSATTGTKIATATSQKLGFFNATPVVQQASIADITTTATGTEISVAVNALITRLEVFGLIATV